MDPENIGKVKAIYEDLKLPKLFLQYEEQAYNDIIARIGQMSGGGSNRRLNPEVFYYFLNKIYKRNRQITIIIPLAFDLISMRVVIQLLTSMKDVHSFFEIFLQKLLSNMSFMGILKLEQKCAIIIERQATKQQY